MTYKIAKQIAYTVVVLSFVLAFGFLPLALAGDNFPAPKGLINDFADIIPPAYQEKMKLIAQEVLAKTGATLTVATFKDIEGNQIDDFTNRLYEKWGVGRKGEDRGVMILLALKERKVRIEVGYGIEGIIPDGLAGQIRDEVMVPYLSKGEYGAGLLNGLASVAHFIAKDKGISLTGLPPAQKKVTSKRRTFSYGIFPFLFLIFIFLFLGRSRRMGAGPLLLLMLLGGGGRGGFGGHSGFGGFGGGFGGFGGGMSGGGGAGGSF